MKLETRKSIALSARPVLEGKSTRHRDVVTSGLREWRMAFDGRYKLTVFDDDPPILCDMSANPLENVNIAADNADVVKRLSELIEQEREI